MNNWKDELLIGLLLVLAGFVGAKIADLFVQLFNLLWR